MGKVRIVSIFSILICVATAHSVASTQCVKQSPPHAVALLELYTSEGCDSCPQADRWISRIDRDGYGIDQAIPLALHVDYWDQLGWKDRFASPRFSERQRMLSSVARNRTIYTPEIFLNLRELRGWDSAEQFRQAVQSINAKPASADIRLELDPTSPAQLPINASFKLKSGAVAGKPQAFIALFENKLSTDVKAGENRGVTLHHDYVVREWIGPIELNGGTAEYKTTVALDRGWRPYNLGVAAFVQDLASAEVLQATALPFCNRGSS